MQILGESFLALRNRFLLPMVHFGIPRSKYEFWSFKDVVTNKIISLRKLTGKSIEIELNKDDYYKALHCDIELFQNKVHIQFVDLLKSKSGSPCWSYVTLYYFAFFNAVCFLRFLNKGFMFLSSEQKSRYESFSIAMYSDPIKLDSGNYFFCFKEENEHGNIILTLTYKGENVHQSNWVQIENAFRGLIPDCDTEELVLLTKLLSIFSQFKNDFPSKLRNKLNYNADSSFLDLDNSLFHIDFLSVNKNLNRELLKLNISIPSDNNIANATACLATYLSKYNSFLYKEYLERSDYGNDFVRIRNKYLRKNNAFGLL